MSVAAKKDDSNVLIIERIFDAPREEVFKAWTDPEQLMNWFCCKDFKVLSAEVDLKVGGKWRSTMESPDGKQYTETGVFHEITNSRRLVTSWVWEFRADEADCNIDYETMITIVFEQYDGDKTKMLFHQEIFETVEARDSHNQGWTEVFDNLEIYLARA